MLKGKLQNSAAEHAKARHILVASDSWLREKGVLFGVAPDFNDTLELEFDN